MPAGLAEPAQTVSLVHFWGLPAALLLAGITACTAPTATSTPPTLTGTSSDAPSAPHEAAEFSEVSAAFDAASRVAKGRIGTVGLAVVDTGTNRTWANEEAGAVERSASVIKVAMAAYMLAKASPAAPKADREKLRLLITESNNTVMYELFEPHAREVIRYLKNYDRQVKYSPLWGWTGVTARGQARFLAALASGLALERSRSAELIGLMRDVVPEQRWGWPDAFPAEVAGKLPVKNGWFVWANGTATVNCLALLPYRGEQEKLAAAVVTAYPAHLGLGYGRRTCRQVATAFTSSLTAP